MRKEYLAERASRGKGVSTVRYRKKRATVLEARPQQVKCNAIPVATPRRSLIKFTCVDQPPDLAQC